MMILLFCYLSLVLSDGRVLQYDETEDYKTWVYASTPDTCTGSTSNPCGPAHWGKLFEGCNAENQSPINIVNGMKNIYNTIPRYPSNFRGCKHWRHSAGRAGYKVVFSQDECPLDMVYNGVNYDLVRLEVHSPSEHTISGRYYQAEAQLVHRDQKGRELIMSVMLSVPDALSFLPSQNNSFFDEIGHSFVRNTEEGTVVVGSDNHRLNPYSLIPGNPTAFGYRGSMTTPPCGDDVEWLVYTTSLSISQADLDAIRHSIGTGAPLVVDGNGNNNRPRQDKGGRDVYVF